MKLHIEERRNEDPTEILNLNFQKKSEKLNKKSKRYLPSNLEKLRTTL